MKYMLLIYSGEKVLSDEEREHCYVESTELCHELNSRNQFLGANPLQRDFDGDQRANSRRKAAADRRAFRRNPRAAGGLFPGRRQGFERGDQHRRADSGGPMGHRRSAAGRGTDRICRPATTSSRGGSLQ